MARHRTHSIEFKRRVVEEYLGGEPLHGLGKRHDLSHDPVMRADVNRGATQCLSKFEEEVCLNHANEGGFRLVGGNRLAFVSGSAVKGVRLLPPNRRLDKMDVGTRAKWAISAQITKIWPPDRCGGKTLPRVVGFG